MSPSNNVGCMLYPATLVVKRSIHTKATVSQIPTPSNKTPGQLIYPPRHIAYSCLKASAGEMRDAKTAGITDAAIPTIDGSNTPNSIANRRLVEGLEYVME